MEATGVYSEPVALALHQAGLMVSVENPACIKGFGHSENEPATRTMPSDAGLIARYCAAVAACALSPPPLEQRQLRARADTARSSLEGYPAGREPAGGVSHRWNGREVVQHVRQHITWLSAEIEKLESDIDDHIDRHPA
ncbi:hypothetical protein [Duganella sp. BJB1802]|uniref:hypothetical protein n=1 Tax=Duganella sp. BJB1802 TaxID=2744575 RepID=UPI001E4F29C7|nr:hypothetical protein [Duganella sp. BJB1802]